jgi:hypothetical protein
LHSSHIAYLLGGGTHQTTHGVGFPSPSWFPRFESDADTSCSRSKSSPSAKATINKDTTDAATSKPRTRHPMLDRFLKEPAKDGHFTGLGRDKATHGKDGINIKL